MILYGNEFWTIKEISNYMELAPVTISGWIRDGKIYGVRIGKKCYVPKGSLMRYLESEEREEAEKHRPDLYGWTPWR